MEIHDLIALLSAVAVLISALAAYLTARSIKRERRAHQLLIKWGEQIEEEENDSGLD